MLTSICMATICGYLPPFKFSGTVVVDPSIIDHPKASPLFLEGASALKEIDASRSWGVGNRNAGDGGRWKQNLLRFEVCDFRLSRYF